jgi:hypothetical protein
MLSGKTVEGEARKGTEEGGQGKVDFWRCIVECCGKGVALVVMVELAGKASERERRECI